MSFANLTRYRYETPVAGLALVAEGGGQRGAFTAGVLDSWQIAKFNPFHILIGTSAGAQNIASYISGQQGYAYSLISDLTNSREFFNPWRVLKNDNAMDLDWYFSHADKPTYLFDDKQASRNAQNRLVRFSASQRHDYGTQLMDPMEHGWLDSLKASSSIPYLYKSQELLDGGVSAPVPVKEAHDLGARLIVTIRTTDRSIDEQDDPIIRNLKKLKPVLCFKGDCPNFIKIMEQHQSSYQNAERFIEQPPEDTQVLEIKPQQPLVTRVLGSSQEQILTDYKQGLHVGKAFIEANHLDLSDSPCSCSDS